MVDFAGLIRKPKFVGGTIVAVLALGAAMGTFAAQDKLTGPSSATVAEIANETATSTATATDTAGDVATETPTSTATATETSGTSTPTPTNTTEAAGTATPTASPTATNTPNTASGKEHHDNSGCIKHDTPSHGLTGGNHCGQQKHGVRLGRNAEFDDVEDTAAEEAQESAEQDD